MKRDLPVADYLTIGRTSEFPDNLLRLFDLEGEPVVVTQVAGVFFAFTNYCGHAGRPLVDGHLEDREVVCPYHGASFNLTTGLPTSALDGPLAMYRIRVTGDEVQLERRRAFADSRPPHLRFVSDL